MPPLFIVIAITEFCVIILDRLIYSSKSIRLKLTLQYITVIAYHLWIFFLLVAAKKKSFVENGVLPFWYLFKTVYWHYSTMQIKTGYPKFNLNLFFMTKSYSLVNRYVCRFPRFPLFIPKKESIQTNLFLKIWVTVPCHLFSSCVVSWTGRSQTPPSPSSSGSKSRIFTPLCLTSNAVSARNNEEENFLRLKTQLYSLASSPRGSKERQQESGSDSEKVGPVASRRLLHHRVYLPALVSSHLVGASNLHGGKSPRDH